VSLKSLTTGVAAATLVGAAAAGMTAIASAPTTPSPAVTPAVFGVPLPLDSDPALLAGQLQGILYRLASGATMTENANLVDGGFGAIEGRTANRLLASARQNGDLPLDISVTNVTAPAPDGSVAATVTLAGPKLAAVSRQVTFVPGGPGGWMVSKSSATALLQSALASG
jgi:hypothetical protein